MTFRNKRRWQIIRGYWIGWTLAVLFLSIVRGVGTTEEGYVEVEFATSLLFVLPFGAMFGSISGFAQILIEERIYKRISIQKLLGLRIVYAFLFLLTTVSISYLVIGKWYFGLNIGFMDFAFDEGSLAIYFYLITVDFFMAFISQVSLMLGPNTLLNLIRGKYYVPREEERIFMFLDLQSSTEHAERLGHIKYSKMIQECFNDLGVVVENEAEIYQYVGDEVVLTWKVEDGLRNQNCLNAYNSFSAQLRKRQAYYQQMYDCSPFFKAGMNAGIVTVTEVGRYKKEIAYHGDAINTAARIQGLCNEYDEALLISEKLASTLNTDNYSFARLGSILLRGKKEEVQVYAASHTSR